MLRQRIATSGPVNAENEEFDITYPIGGDSTFQSVTVPTQFSMGAGCMVIVSIDQPFPTFMVPIAAGIDNAGIVTIRLFYVLGIVAPTNFTTHLYVVAHDKDQLGR